MKNITLLYLNETQAKELVSWKEKFGKSDFWNSWCKEEETSTKRIRRIIETSNFLTSNNLSESQLDELFILLKTGLGNRQMRQSLYTENDVDIFNEKLRFLLNEDEPLPVRFDNFLKLKNIGIWTASQFLSKWEPSKYPLVATSGKKGFMDRVIINQLEDSQLELAKEDALRSYGIKENSVGKTTLDYLKFQQIFNEIREICEYASYLEVQNLLWMAFRENNELSRATTKIKKIKEIRNANSTDDLYGKSDSSKTSAPERIFRHVKIWKRNQRYVTDLKNKYSGKCQFAGCPLGTFAKRDGSPYAEAHHPKPLGENGADQLGNLIILCPTHHKMFHYANAQIKGVKDRQAIVNINGKIDSINFEQGHFENFKSFYQEYLRSL